MKKFLQGNLRREAQELMDIQGLLKESDHQNRQLNREVIKLLQENTRLKMEKVQQSIVTLPKESRQTVQNICNKRVQEFKSHSKKKGEASPLGRMKISVISGNKPQNGKQTDEIVPNGQTLNEESVFFTFGGSKRPPNIRQRRQCMGVYKESEKIQQKGSQFQSGQRKQDNHPIQQQTPKQETHLTPQNHDKFNKKDESCPKKGKSIHSILPSPQITPKKGLYRQSTPVKCIKQLSKVPSDSNNKALPQKVSIEKRRKYIDIVSVFLTPSRSSN